MSLTLFLLKLDEVEDSCASGIHLGVNEGNCNCHAQCQIGLGCASCPAFLGYNSDINCCTTNGVDNGEWGFCSTSEPCGIHEGDCDDDDECKDGLKCGNSNCPISFGFGPEVDCCSLHGGEGDFDFLSIHDGGSEDSEWVAKLTGQKDDIKIAIPGNQMFLVFHTNEDIVRKGFHALIMESKCV